MDHMGTVIFILGVGLSTIILLLYILGYIPWGFIIIIPFPIVSMIKGEKTIDNKYFSYRCPRCGYKLKGFENFCPVCGYKLR